MAGICRHGLWGLAIVVGAAGCLPVQPRLGYPWVESRDLTLRRERLEIRLFRQGSGARAEVHARFHFQALRSLPALGIGFPEDRRDARLEGYRSTLDGRRLPAWRRRGGALRGFLPLEDVPHWYESLLPAVERGRQMVVDVRYTQPLRRGRLRYLLRTGAYWRHPIGRLYVRVTAGPGVRILTGELEGKSVAPRAGALRWDYTELEPRGDLVVRFVVSEEVSK